MRSLRFRVSSRVTPHEENVVMASTYEPTQSMYSRNAFTDLNRRVREDQHGGIDALDQALGKGIRLILTHRIAKENVEDASLRVLELTAGQLRANEIEPDRIPRMVVSLIHQ